MSNQIKGFTVTLNQDISEEGAERLINAILMLKEVIDVVPIKKDPQDYMIKMRFKNSIKKALFGFIDEHLSLKK